MSNTFLFGAIQSSQTVLIQTIQFSISMQFLFYLTHRKCPIRCYHSGPEWTWEQCQWRGTPHSPNPHWNLAIRLFSVISRTLVGEVLPLRRKPIGVFYSPSRLVKYLLIFLHLWKTMIILNYIALHFVCMEMCQKKKRKRKRYLFYIQLPLVLHTLECVVS